jgi:DNA helicase-2/ATP-dependent DNA helicase PcrA
MLLSYASQDDELLGGIRAVKKILQSPGRDIGVLFRYNKAVDEFASLLTKEGVSAFRVSQKDIMHHPIMLDFISLLRVHAGNASRLDWYRLVYRFSKSQNTKSTRLQASQFVDELADIGISPQLILPLSKEEAGEISFEHQARALVNLERRGELVIFDTETTSTDPNKASLLQLAAAKVKEGKIIEEFNKFIQVSDPDEEFLRDLEDSQSIHNIDLKLLDKEGKPAEEVLREFIEFCGESALLAHNLPYDLAVLTRHTYVEKTATQFEPFFQNRATRMFDSLSIVRHMYPRETSYTLESLISNFNLEGTNSHDAMDDVRATASLVYKLISDLEPRLEKIDETLESNRQFASTTQQHTFEFLRTLWIQDFGPGMNDTKTRLSYFLRDWVAYVRQRHGWYNIAILDELEKEIEDKVIGWMDRNLPEGRLCDLLLSDKAKSLAYLSEVDLIDPERDRVVVSTIHRAKGLAFETVLLPQVVDDTYPSFRAKKENDLEQMEEDKRLLYVGLSRPKKKLIVTYHRLFRSYRKELSRYLSPIVDKFEFIWPKKT